MNNKHFVSMLLFLVTLPACGEIYKWVDEQGNTHFSDKPVSEQSTTQVYAAEPETQKTVQDQESREERRRRLADVMQEDRLKKKEEKAKQREQEAELNKKCIYAKDQLRQYEDSGYLYRLDKDGNRVIMPDEHRVAAINDLRAQIRKNCGS